MYGLKEAHRLRKIDEALEIVGLKDRRKERVERFSGGMKRRLKIAAGMGG